MKRKSARKKFPSKSTVRMDVCEDVRSEVNSKISLMGLYVGGRIVVLDSGVSEKGKPVAALHSVALVLYVGGASGEFRQDIKVQLPSGGLFQMPKVRFGTLKAEADKFAVSVIFLRPFIAPEFGKYTVIYRLDNRDYEFAFTVSLPAGK